MNLLALACGLLFGCGVMLSGMVDPAKVIGFLDVAGRWDPTLAWVMVGAIGVNLVPMRLAMGRTRSVGLRGAMEIPKPGAVTRRLVAGSLMFGAGWGLSGVCPGPALAGLASLHPDRLLFFGFMLVGMVAYEQWNAAVSRPRAAQPRSVTLRADSDGGFPVTAQLARRDASGDMVVLAGASLPVGGRYRVDDAQAPEGPPLTVRACRAGTREADCLRDTMVIHLQAEKS